MSSEFHILEESLKEFLINAQSDSYNSRNISLPKYNNLKIYMDSNQNRTPHFIVRIGISEAMYNIMNSEKINGGLGSDERYIRRWMDRTSIRSDLQGLWKKNQKVKPVTVTEDPDD